jgi:hypothetical protein
MWWDERQYKPSKFGLQPSDFKTYIEYRRANKQAADRVSIKKRYDANPERFRQCQAKYHDRNREAAKQRRIDAWGPIDEMGSGSKCERYTYLLLQEFFPGVPIERQHYICLTADEKLKSGRKRIFVDFYIPSKKLMVEYNGSQHYGESNKYFDKFQESIKGYLDTMPARDKFLEDWCVTKGITLVIVDGRVARRPHQIKSYLYPLLENRRRKCRPVACKSL